MASPQLGQLDPVDLREVWPNEQSDFTPWLANQENLDILANALGIPLEFVAREEEVGSYSADILCRDADDDVQVVVENQLEATDHDHLGKLLTYAAHLGARVLVWVARKFTDQHRAALDWLNEVSETGTRFFGVEVEVWRIGDSALAPKFSVIARPNDWTKKVSPLTPIQTMQLDFWQGFAEFVDRNGSIVRKINAPRPQTSLGMTGLGRTGFYLYGTVSTWSDTGDHELRADLVINGPDAAYYYDLLSAAREEIEEEFGSDLTWQNPDNTAQRKICARTSADFNDPDRRTQQYQWLLEKLEAVHRILAPRIVALPAPE